MVEHLNQMSNERLQAICDGLDRNGELCGARKVRADIISQILSERQSAGVVIEGNGSIHFPV